MTAPAFAATCPLCGEPPSAPVIRATLPCRFGCKTPAAAIVHYPQACICFLDPVQALCAQHAQKGLQNNDGVVVAWLQEEREEG